MAPRILPAATQTQDPLLCSVPLSHQTEFHPHGFPVRLATNSQAVISAAEESWGGTPRRFDEPPLEVWCLVSGAGGRSVPPAPVVRARRNLLASAADADNVFTCDLAAGLASIWITESVAAIPDYLRYNFLEAAVYCLLDTRHVVTVHAACVSMDGRGVLLAGDSGAGKTSLAYACARRGWVYTSDDASRIVRRNSGRAAFGNPRVFRFRESAGRLFPEFAGMKESRRANGKPTIEVRTESLPEIRTAERAQIDHVVFLNRTEKSVGAALEPVEADEAYTRLRWNPWPAELPGAEERKSALRRLSTAPSHDMSYCDLDAAVDKLEQLVRGGSQ